MRVLTVAFALLSLGTVACGGPTSTGGAGTAGAPAPSQELKPYSNLLQLMRGIPFPNSNIIFDTQTVDPAAPKTKVDASGPGATARYSAVYAGWEVVEYSAVALGEVANLIMIPGRVCSNGKPVPIDQPDFKKYAQGLADAGMAAYKAAQSKNLDAMIEVSGTVSDACAACHEVYRDIGPAGGPERCTPPAAAPAK